MEGEEERRVGVLGKGLGKSLSTSTGVLEKERRRKRGRKGMQRNAEESCHTPHTPTGLIPRRRLMAVDNRTDTHTHITKAPKVTPQTEMYCAG